MDLFTETGLATTLLKLIAASIGEGIVVGSFVVAVAATIGARSGQAAERDALRDVFWGGVGGISCLCFDLLVGSF